MSAQSPAEDRVNPVPVCSSNELIALRLLNIPEEHQNKPERSLTELVLAALNRHISTLNASGIKNDGGLLASDIAKLIMEMFPYYRYCSSRWKLALRSTLQETYFSKVSETSRGWTYSINKQLIASNHELRQHIVRL